MRDYLFFVFTKGDALYLQSDILINELIIIVLTIPF